MMPYLHSALWVFFFATLAFVAWRASARFDLRLPAFDLRRAAAPAAAVRTWFPPSTRYSGNSAFDDWRDSEIARLERERQSLETKLHAFEAFVDKLKRAKDRATFERFVAAHPELAVAMPESMARQAEDTGEHHPA